MEMLFNVQTKCLAYYVNILYSYDAPCILLENQYKINFVIYKTTNIWNQIFEYQC